MLAHRKAFTLVEMLVVLLLFGVVATILGPRMFRRSTTGDWEVVVGTLNNLFSFAKQESITQQKCYRVAFDVKRDGSRIIVEQESLDPEKPERKIYQQSSSYYLSTTYSLPQEIAIKAIYSGNKKILDDSGGVVYCYLVPEGLAQPFVIHMDKRQEKEPEGITLTIDPFTAQFSMATGFHKS